MKSVAQNTVTRSITSVGPTAKPIHRFAPRTGCVCRSSDRSSPRSIHACCAVRPMPTAVRSRTYAHAFKAPSCADLARLVTAVIQRVRCSQGTPAAAISIACRARVAPRCPSASRTASAAFCAVRTPIAEMRRPASQAHASHAADRTSSVRSDARVSAKAGVCGVVGRTTSVWVDTATGTHSCAGSSVPAPLCTVLVRAEMIASPTYALAEPARRDVLEATILARKTRAVSPGRIRTPASASYAATTRARVRSGCRAWSSRAARS